MEGNQRWLGWAAIGLAVLALLAAFGGRGWHPGRHGYGHPGMAASEWVGPGGVSGMHGGAEQVAPPNSDYARGFLDGTRAAQRFDGMRHGPPWFFGGPFLLGWLIKPLLLGLLILLALKAFGRRRDSGGGPTGTPPTQPGPERPPYTGETQSL